MLTFKDCESIVSGLMEKGRYWSLDYEKNYHTWGEVDVNCRIYAEKTDSQPCISVTGHNWDMAVMKLKEALGLLNEGPAPDAEIDNAGFFVETKFKEEGKELCQKTS